MTTDERLAYLVHDSLFRDWDPIGVNDNEAVHDEYGSYVPCIVRLLQDGVNERQLADHLSRLRCDTMGLSHIDAECDHRIALRLTSASELASRATPVHTVRELIDRYEKGCRDFTESEIQTTDTGSLDRIVLDGAILQASFLSASFVAASLRGCNFRQSNIKASDFTNADLRFADFCNCALCSTTFRGARLDGARFAGSYYHNHELAENELPDW